MPVTVNGLASLIYPVPAVIGCITATPNGVVFPGSVVRLPFSVASHITEMILCPIDSIRRELNYPSATVARNFYTVPCMALWSLIYCAMTFLTAIFRRSVFELTRQNIEHLSAMFARVRNFRAFLGTKFSGASIRTGFSFLSSIAVNLELFTAYLACCNWHEKTSCQHQLVRLSRACNCQQEARKTIALCALTDNVTTPSTSVIIAGAV